MILKTYYVDTTTGVDLIHIGHEVRHAIREAKAEEGAVSVVIPHPGAGFAILDTDDPKNQKKEDLRKALEGQLPVAAVLLPKTIHLPFERGRLATEPWQDLYLVDYLKTGRRREYKIQVSDTAPKENNEKNQQPLF